MVAFAMTAMVACGEKDNTTDNSGSNNNGGGSSQNTTELAGTSWRYTSGEYGESAFVDVIFNFISSVSATLSVHANGNQQIMGGQYTCSNDSGSIALKDMSTGEDCGNATFTIDGTRMNFAWSGQTYTLTKQ